jgi:hypothetical protein
MGTSESEGKGMSINENTETKDVDMIEEKNRILDESESLQEFNEAIHDMLLRNFFGEEIDGKYGHKGASGDIRRSN